MRMRTGQRYDLRKELDVSRVAYLYDVGCRIIHKYSWGN